MTIPFSTVALVLLTFCSCAAPPPSPRTACGATGGLVGGVAYLLPHGGVTATGSRYSIPFATSAPVARLFVSPDGDDSAAGTESAPKRTLQAAVDAATPGTAVMVKAGSYTENVTLTHSGSAGSPIWLVSADGAGAAQLVPARLDTSTVQGYAVHDWVLQGLDVTAPAPTSGDSDGIKFAADGDVSMPIHQNRNLAIVDTTVHCATAGGYNGVKISTADGVFIVHDVLDGAGGAASGVALDFVGNTNSEIAYTYASNVPTHTALQIKGGSTTILVHDNLVESVGGDALWIGGGTIELYMHPSIAYEACDITVNNNVMHDLGGGAIHFVGGQNSSVTHLFSFHASNHYINAEVSADHSPNISSVGNSVLHSVFELSTQSLVYVATNNQGTVTVDPANDLPFTLVSNSAPLSTFQGGAWIASGGGGDVYELNWGQGSTVIDGFKVANDVVRLVGYPGLTFAGLLDGAHQVGPSVLIDLPDGFLVVLDGVSLEDLSNANFAF